MKAGGCKGEQGVSTASWANRGGMGAECWEIEDGSGKKDELCHG